MTDSSKKESNKELEETRKKEFELQKSVNESISKNVDSQSHKEKIQGLPPNARPNKEGELTDDEKKGIKRTGTPLTQEKVATLGTKSKDDVNPELNRSPMLDRLSGRSEGEDSNLPNIQSETKPQDEKSDEEKFIDKNNPDFSPGYMHDHDSKVSMGDKVQPSSTDKSSTVRPTNRVAPTANNPFIPEPLIGNESPDPQILPQNKEDLMATIRAILKVTSADNQQLEIALVRIAAQIPANYNPRVFPLQKQTHDKNDDSQKRAMNPSDYNRTKSEIQNAEGHSIR